MGRNHGDGLVAIVGRIGVIASVAMNLAALTFVLRGRIFSAGASEKEVNKKVKKAAAVAPSSGKGPVSNDSTINLDHGDPTMFETFWRGPMGEHATVVIPGWQTMSYFSNVGNLCWFLEPSFEREVRRLHHLVGNVAAEGYHVLVGTGSMQLFQAAVYALAPPVDVDATPTSVISPAPFYSSYPVVTDFLNSRLYRWAGDANTFDGDDSIELVCSPNNPDGIIREAVLKSKTRKSIHDLAYYWPQYTPITHMLVHDIMLFTVSKCTGHAGTRIGWALVKDRKVAQKMNKFMELNTIGVSKDSQLRAAKILGAVADGYEHQPVGAASGDANLLFHYARRQMMYRWRTLRAVVAASGIFSLPDEVDGFCTFAKDTVGANPAFAWMRCDKEGVEDLEVFLREHKIITRSGVRFGADRKVVRISMVDTDEAFNILVDRLAAMK